MLTAIILAGGVGSRMQLAIPKQFMALAGKPVIMHTLERLEKIDEIDEVVIVCQPHYKEFVDLNIEAYMLKKKYILVDGGASRQESTYNGLIASSNDTVIIHEAARPFVRTQEFVALAQDPCKNIIYGSPLGFTVLKQKDGMIDGNLDRSSLVNVQLPHKFDKEALLDVHEKAKVDGLHFTEDASILYHYTEAEIKVLPGTDYNIKITTPVDIITGELIYKEYVVGRN